MNRSEAVASEPAPGPGVAPRWIDRWRDWRNRTIAKPGFQRWAAAFPLTRPIARRHAGELFDLVAGFVYSQVLLACVRLKVFELLADGALPLPDLAQRCGLSREGAERLVADSRPSPQRCARSGSGKAPSASSSKTFSRTQASSTCE